MGQDAHGVRQISWDELEGHPPACNTTPTALEPVPAEVRNTHCHACRVPRSALEGIATNEAPSACLK